MGTEFNWDGMTNDIDSPPIPSELYPIVYSEDLFVVSWSQNNDDDFQFYNLYESDNEYMTNKILISSIEDKNVNSYNVDYLEMGR